jgi:ABC-2 type transport system ATP-binding protein
MEKHSENIAIQVKNLTRFYGDLKAVDRLSLEVRRGEVFGFLGPNGAGKTTSINMICGLLKPDEGEIVINGKKISGTEGTKIRSKVGVCPQNIILWPKLTCFEQLVFLARMYDIPNSIAKKRADSLLEQLDLQEKRNKLANTLSGGMQRRLNVMMALIHDPDLVIFDEPEAGLDPQSRLLVRDFIIHTARDKTVIFTTHNMDEAERVSDRVAIIDRGKLLQLDTPGNLKKSIGEGDIMELTIQHEDITKLPYAIKELEKKGMDILQSDEKLIIKSMNLIEQVHGIYIILESANIKVIRMSMRENTLEDVFIHLTGRRLRQ